MSRSAFTQIEALIADARERALRAGVSRVTVDEVLMRAEAAMVRDVAKAARAEFEYLRSVPTATVAEVRGVTRRAVQYQRARAAKTKQIGATFSRPSD